MSEWDWIRTATEQARRQQEQALFLDELERWKRLTPEQRASELRARQEAAAAEQARQHREQQERQRMIAVWEAELEPIRRVADPVERYLRAIQHMEADPHPLTLADPIGVSAGTHVTLKLRRYLPGIDVPQREIVRWFTDHATGDGNKWIRRVSCVVVTMGRTLLGRSRERRGPPITAWCVRGQEHPAYLSADNLYRARSTFETPFREGYDGRVLAVELPHSNDGLSIEERLTIASYILPSALPRADSNATVSLNSSTTKNRRGPPTNGQLETRASAAVCANCAHENEGTPRRCKKCGAEL